MGLGKGIFFGNVPVPESELELQLRERKDKSIKSEDGVSSLSAWYCCYGFYSPPHIDNTSFPWIIITHINVKEFYNHFKNLNFSHHKRTLKIVKENFFVLLALNL